MRQAARAAILLLLGGLTACTQAAPAFDYWVLALSWSPQYCASQPRGTPQCQRPYAFVVHGLWPQFERGYPAHCEPKPAPVPEAWINRLLPLMPSPALIEHQWRKHGTCSGLGVDGYFEATLQARSSVVIPPAFVAPEDYLHTSPAQIRAQFLAHNPGLSPAALSLHCEGRHLRELRLCLDRGLQFRACGADVKDRCPTDRLSLRPSRAGASNTVGDGSAGR
jgi:ribonuclease T2